MQNTDSIRQGADRLAQGDAVTATPPGFQSEVQNPGAPWATEMARPWLQDAWLWILLAGPLVAPLFVALGTPVLRPFADGIYLIGEAVCPKVDVHLMFLGQPMAVCSSCWAAVLGLWAVRLLHGRAGEGFGPFSRLGVANFWRAWNRSPVPARFARLALSFVPWFVDVTLWDLGAWASPQAYMTFAGFLGGLGAGALLLPAAAGMRARRAWSKEVG
jgi:Predicted membrane protein (DUF2085)